MPDQKPLAITADDVAVSLAVRDDLGLQHEPAVIAEFLDRVGAAIDERVEEQVAQRLKRVKGGGTPGLPFFSLVFGIPLTAIASTEDLPGMLIVWGGIALVNLADALRR